jgi:hypothetical protein
MTAKAKEKLVQDIADIQTGIKACSQLDRNNYVWQAQDWIFGETGSPSPFWAKLTDGPVIKRAVGKSTPESLRRWFKAQVPVMRSFQNPLPGRPRAEDRPMYCWWFLMQGYS